jgi:hypothetical protein
MRTLTRKQRSALEDYAAFGISLEQLRTVLGDAIEVDFGPTNARSSFTTIIRNQWSASNCSTSGTQWTDTRPEGFGTALRVGDHVVSESKLRLGRSRPRRNLGVAQRHQHPYPETESAT